MGRFRLRNVKTAAKIIGAFGIVCLVLGALGVAGIWTTAQMKDQTTAIAAHDIPQIIWLTATQNAANNAERDLMQATLEPDEQLWQAQLDQTRADQQALHDAFAHYTALEHNGAETQDIASTQRVLDLWDGTLTMLRQQMTFGSVADTTAVTDTINDLWQPQSVALSQNIAHLIAIDRAQTEREHALATQLFTRLAWGLGIGIALAFALSISMGLYIARHIARPLVRMVSVTHRVAQGHLDAIDDLLARYHGADEMGQFLAAFDGMLASLRQLIARVLATGSNVSALSASLDDVPGSTPAGEAESPGPVSPAGGAGTGLGPDHPASGGPSGEPAAPNLPGGGAEPLSALPGNALAQAAHQIDSIDHLNRKLVQAYQELADSHRNLEVAHQTIQRQALTDPLTGLPNHRALVTQLDRELQRAERSARPMGLIFFDGDRFKRVNDAHGHAAGDAVLRQLGERVQAVIRATDTLGRYGGEEFVALLPDVDREQALTIAERMRTAVESAPMATELVAGGLEITISAGVALYPADANTSAALLMKADQAMYLAKRGGRNRVCDAGDVQQPDPSGIGLGNDEDDECTRDAQQPSKQLRQQVQTQRDGMVAALVKVLRIYDSELAQHSEHVSRLAIAIARELGAPPATLDRIAQAALLHDIGKLGVAPAILQKPGTLTDEEWQAVRQHAPMSANVIASSPILRDLLPGVRHHHERWDGSGYPDGLQSELIPLEARIIAIADAFDAMNSERPYKAALDITAALAEIERCAGTHFDPSLVPVACKAIRRYEEEESRQEAA